MILPLILFFAPLEFPKVYLHNDLILDTYLWSKMKNRQKVNFLEKE